MVRPMAGKAGSPESESLKSVVRQTTQTDDLQFTSLVQTEGGARPDAGKADVER